jgi:glucose/mannose-6-phosphate isomerase
MDKLISDFPSNINEALVIASNSQFQKPKKDIRNVLVCGMGGSGIGGKMVSFWAQDHITVPMQSFQDYTCPGYVNEHTLIIASSYSGNTEETLICVKQAKVRGAQIIAVCSGGEILDFCKNNGYDFVVVPGGNPPRTALAFSVVQVLNILVQHQLVPSSLLKDIKKSEELLISDLEEIKVEARKLAEITKDSVPVFYASAKYDAVAVRARQQFNENSKILCWHHVLPEMNHNELVGWGGGDKRFTAVFFDTGDLIPRNQKRLEITRDVVAKKTTIHNLPAKGNSFIERSFYLIHLVDWASYYASQIKKVDAFDIDIIDFLKDELAKFK